jgi:hypothetical protein
MDLRGAVALVTGGNGGLGQCIWHADRGLSGSAMVQSYPAPALRRYYFQKVL